MNLAGLSRERGFIRRVKQLICLKERLKIEAQK